MKAMPKPCQKKAFAGNGSAPFSHGAAFGSLSNLSAAILAKLKYLYGR
jgi:hypothetical protein